MPSSVPKATNDASGQDLTQSLDVVECTEAGTILGSPAYVSPEQATMRHTGAGLAILDFPLMFGGIVPDHSNAGIANHFAHRLGAIVVAAIAIATSVFVWRPSSEPSESRACVVAHRRLHRFSGHTRRAHGAGPAPAVDQQPAGGRRRGGADDIARHHAVELALSDCGSRIANWAPADETSGLECR